MQSKCVVLCCVFFAYMNKLEAVNKRKEYVVWKAAISICVHGVARIWLVVHI